MNHWLVTLSSFIPPNVGHLVAFGVSVIAAFGIGSVLSALISRNAQKRVMLSQMRSDWINSLREDLASFAAFAEIYEYSRQKSNQNFASLEEIRSQKIRLAHKIILQLNPFEDDHIQLEAIIRKMNSSASTSYRNRFRIFSRKVLKREWTVTKDGAMSEKKQMKWTDNWNKELRKRPGKLRKNLKTLAIKKR